MRTAQYGLGGRWFEGKILADGQWTVVDERGDTYGIFPNSDEAEAEALWLASGLGRPGKEVTA